MLMLYGHTYIISKYAINILMFHLGFHIAQRMSCRATLVSPFNWPTNGTVRLGESERDMAANIRYQL